MASILVELFRHNLWANLRLIDACTGLADAQLDATVHGTAGTIRGILLHICGAEQRYVKLLSGREHDRPMRVRDGWVGFDSLREGARWSGEALVEIASQADPAQVLRVPYQGQTHSVAASTVLIQAINHATDHRSQIATILTQQGVTPPELDGWQYGEEASAASQSEGRLSP